MFCGMSGMGYMVPEAAGIQMRSTFLSVRNIFSRVVSVWFISTMMLSSSKG